MANIARKFTRAWRGRRRLKNVVGINRRNVELVYAYNKRRDYPLVDNKIRTKEVMEAEGIPVAPTLHICEGLFAIPKVAKALRGRGNFVIKPASGSGGDGILVTGEKTESGWLTTKGAEISDADIRQHLANTVFGAFSKQLEDQALVEERIVSHSFFDELFNSAVSDIRLLFLRGRCLMAMVRVPTKRSGGRANLHQGGIGVAVDLETGRTTRALSRSKLVTHHPESGTELVDRQLPRWHETLDVGRRAAKAVPLGYLGVDIVVDESHGPLVLELNARPGLEIQNVNGRALGPVVEGFVT